MAVDNQPADPNAQNHQLAIVVHARGRREDLQRVADVAYTALAKLFNGYADLDLIKIETKIIPKGEAPVPPNSPCNAIEAAEDKSLSRVAGEMLPVNLGPAAPPYIAATED